MAKCSVCGKGVVFGHQVSHSNRKTNRAWKPNIRKVKVSVEPASLAFLALADGFFVPSEGQCYHTLNNLETIVFTLVNCEKSRILDLQYFIETFGILCFNYTIWAY